MAKHGSGHSRARRRRTRHSQDRNYVTVTGQVFNPTAVAYAPGRSAKWYLSQAGGLTQLGEQEGGFRGARRWVGARSKK